jgi:hypothetical protein
MFDIPVKIEGIEKRKRSIAVFHILAGLFLAANASLFFKYLNYSTLWPLLPVYLVAVASLFYGFFRMKIDAGFKWNKWLRLLQFLTFLVLGFSMLSSERAVQSIILFIWAVICLTLLFTERFVFQQPSIKISHDGINTPGSFTSKNINWSSLESVVVRNDYITLNYTNNQYLQFEVVKMLSGIEIERINIFCKEKLGNSQRQQQVNTKD